MSLCLYAFRFYVCVCCFCFVLLCFEFYALEKNSHSSQTFGAAFAPGNLFISQHCKRFWGTWKYHLGSDNSLDLCVIVNLESFAAFFLGVHNRLLSLVSFCSTAVSMMLLYTLYSFLSGPDIHDMSAPY